MRQLKRYIDEVAVGRQVAPKLRVAFEVDDGPAVTARLVAAGATELAPPTETPWKSVNSRLEPGTTSPEGATLESPEGAVMGELVVSATMIRSPISVRHDTVFKDIVCALLAGDNCAVPVVNLGCEVDDLAITGF